MKWRCASGVAAGVVHLHDVRVHQLRGGQRLAPEAGDEAVVLGEVLGQQLHRDLALEHAVQRAVHRRHAAGAEALVEPVAARDLDAEHRHLLIPPATRRRRPGCPLRGPPRLLRPCRAASGSASLLRLLLLGLLVLFGLSPVWSPSFPGWLRGSCEVGADRRLFGRRRRLRRALVGDQRLEPVGARDERVLSLESDASGSAVDLLAQRGRLLAGAGAVLVVDTLLDLVEGGAQGGRRHVEGSSLGALVSAGAEHDRRSAPSAAAASMLRPFEHGTAGYSEALETLVQPFRQRLRQACVDDRLGRLVDRVLDAPERGRPGLGVEHQVGGARDRRRAAGRRCRGSRATRPPPCSARRRRAPARRSSRRRCARSSTRRGSGRSGTRAAAARPGTRAAWEIDSTYSQTGSRGLAWYRPTPAVWPSGERPARKSRVDDSTFFRVHRAAAPALIAK